MDKKCRFCGGEVFLKFPANQKDLISDPNLFTCTNCGFGSHGPIVECLSCGVIYVDEKITQEKISTYYEVAEDRTYFEEQKAREVTFKRYLNKLEKIFPKKGKLLDVGTNTGLFVKVARDSGWDAIGIEPNKWGVNYAKQNYGINLINKPFDKGVFKPESFDVITMWDVIEHFTEPVIEMKKVYWYLKSGGVFAFSTVDPKSVLARIMGTKWSWYMIMHRVFFDRKSASYYLKDCNFSNAKFSSHWRNLSLGYLATRLAAINLNLSRVAVRLIEILGLSKIIVPYYANDLFDCYVYKKSK